MVKTKLKKVEVPKKINLAKLIEIPKNEKKEEKKQEPTEETEDVKIPEFSFNINEVFRRGRLSLTLDEDNEKKQTLEDTTKDAPKKEEQKEETKKVYENLYSQNNQLYKNQRRDEPEIRVNQRTTSASVIISNAIAPAMQPTLRRAEMVREDRFSMGASNENRDTNQYELSRRRDPNDVNPFSPEMDIKEKKYKI